MSPTSRYSRPPPGHPAIHPILGARRPTRLGAGTEPDLGFPATFIRDTGQWVFGAAALTG
jgi:hypothetical protein